MQKKKDHEQINDGLLDQANRETGIQGIIEDLAKENKQAAVFIRMALNYAQFAGLVKLMREAQGKVEQMDNDTWDEDVYHDMCQLESEVDKRIKELGV